MYHGSLTSAIRLTNDYHTPQNLSRVGRKPVKFGFKKSVFTPQTNGGGGGGVRWSCKSGNCTTVTVAC